MVDASVSIRKRRGNRRIHTPARARTRDWVSDSGSFRIEKGRALSLGLTIVGLLGFAFAGGYLVGRRAEKLIAFDGRIQVPGLDSFRSGASMHPPPKEEDLHFFEALAKKSNVSENTVAAGEQRSDPARGEAPVVVSSSSSTENVSQRTSQAQEMPELEEPEDWQAKPAVRRDSANEATVLDRTLKKLRKEYESRSVPDYVERLGLDGSNKFGYTVQVSAFRTSEEAQNYLSQLSGQGLRAYIVKGVVKDDGKEQAWYRVRLGHFEDVAQAKQARAYLEQRSITGFVLKTD